MLGDMPVEHLDQGARLLGRRHQRQDGGRSNLRPREIALRPRRVERLQEVADGIVRGISNTIAKKMVTYDFERLMTGAKLLKCSEFGKAVVENC